ncbi:MAG: hypothetical protein Q7S57_05540 [bacterium]|nr:hypothetical protein [bacterium]
MYKISQINPIRCFPIIFLAIFLISLFLWNTAGIADGGYWVGKKIQLVNDLRTHSFDFNPSIHSTHPGTFPLLVSNLFPSNLFSPLRSIRLACVIIDSFATFFILFYVFKIYRNNLWWLVWIAILLGSDYALFTNPSDIITAKLLGLAWIITLYHVKERKTLPLDTLFIGVCIGLALASRIHMTLMLAVFIPVLIWYYHSFKNMIILAIIAIAVFFLTDPYLWHSPFSFLSSSLLGTTSLIDTDIATNIIPAYYFREVTFSSFILDAPLTFIAFISLSFLITLKHKLTIPRLFLMALFLTISVTTVLLLKSSMNNLRFFYQIIFILHIFLSLFTMDILYEKLFIKFNLYARQIFYLALFTILPLQLLALFVPSFSNLALWFSRIIIFYIIVLIFVTASLEKKSTQTHL